MKHYRISWQVKNSRTCHQWMQVKNNRTCNQWMQVRNNRTTMNCRSSMNTWCWRKRALFPTTNVIAITHSDTHTHTHTLRKGMRRNLQWVVLQFTQASFHTFSHIREIGLFFQWARLGGWEISLPEPFQHWDVLLHHGADIGWGEAEIFLPYPPRLAE